MMPRSTFARLVLICSLLRRVYLSILPCRHTWLEARCEKRAHGHGGAGCLHNAVHASLCAGIHLVGNFYSIGVVKGFWRHAQTFLFVHILGWFKLIKVSTIYEETGS